MYDGSKFNSAFSSILIRGFTCDIKEENKTKVKLNTSDHSSPDDLAEIKDEN